MMQTISECTESVIEEFSVWLVDAGVAPKVIQGLGNEVR